MAEPEVFAVPSASAEPEPAPSVSMIVPIFEEEATVDELYRRTVAALEQDGRTFEILFVDDGSRDGTFSRLEQLHAADPRVLENFWVRYPAAQLLAEHMKSMKQEAPVRPGTPDPYLPPP